MKRVLLVVSMLALAPAVSAQLYKYVDKDGKTVYSDQPPVNVDSKQINVRSGSATAQKSAVEVDKEVQKARDDAREKDKKTADAEKKAQEAQARCNQAKSAYQTYAEGGRIHRFDEKGERYYLGDQEIEAERERTRRDMEEACKKS